MELPSWMPLPLFIVLMVLAGLLTIWILAIIVALSFSTVFKRRLRNDSNAINMILTQRYEIMLDFIKIAEIHKVKIPEEEKKSINLLERINDYQALSKKDRDQRVLAFIHASHNIISICDHSSLANEEEYLDKLVEFNDAEELYRQKSALYNSNVIGYNYWIRILGVKTLFKIFGKKPKDLIV